MIGKILPSDQTDLFRMRLEQMVNMRHELIFLSKELDWTWIESELSGYYAAEDRPAIPVRTMVGMLLLEQMFNQSDESVIDRWVENPYWQYFTGEEFFQHKAPFDPSDYVHFRKRVGENGMEKVLCMTIPPHYGSESEPEVMVDTTVQEKNITHPTDSKLAYKIIKYCWRYAEVLGIDLRQSYRFVVKDLRLKMHNASHPKRLKEARRAQRRLRGIAGRLVRDLWRKMDKEALAMNQESLELFQQVLAQDRSTKDKRYRLHEPDAWCIAKGKLRVIRPVPFNGQTDRKPVLVQSELRDTSLPLGHVASGYAPSRRLVSLAPFGVWTISGTYRMPRKEYEFGCMVSVARASDSGVIVGMKSFKGNPYDGDTLKDALDQVERIRVAAGGTRPEPATAYRGCKGRPLVGTTKILTHGKGTKPQTANEKKKQRQLFRNRVGIEPVIGHLKSDHRMGRNFWRGHGEIRSTVYSPVQHSILRCA